MSVHDGCTVCFKHTIGSEIVLERVLILTQARCTVCVECTIGLEITLDASIGLLGDVGHVESRFSSF